MTQMERNSMMETVREALTNRETDFYGEEMGQQLIVCLMTDDWSHLNSAMLQAVHNKHHKEVA